MPQTSRSTKQKPSSKPAFIPELQALDLRYPYNGDRYRAEGRERIRVERDGVWGYFDSYGRWLEGPLRSANGPFCRFMSTSWVMAERAGLVQEK